MIGTDQPRADVVTTAREALVAQVGADVVGEHLGVVSEGTNGEQVDTHYFDSLQAGYPGWRWAVTAVVLDDVVTIDEIVLLPGDTAIVAPPWVPWRERIRPGDLSAGDILPTDEDDPRLVPAYLTGDDGLDEAFSVVADELGLGRSRVLSLEGREQAAQRWYDGEHGPDVPLAQSAPARCGGCGFLVRLAGPLSETFGVCANAFANDDGQVVAFTHGCGAHSEAQLRKKQLPPPMPDPAFDTVSRDDLEVF